MLTIFEKDIFVNSLLELNTLQERIRLTTWYLVSLGILALVVIIFFLVLILKDITRSQRYRSELEQAKAYSDSLLKSKEQIMLSITHDIKSPLASVVGYARLMSETENKDRKEIYLTNINKSSDHILKLISDLVDLTRLETGKLKFDYTHFNLYELVNDSCSGFYPLASSKQLDFRFEYHLPENAHYYSDPVRLKQVLGNIISNAVKYTDTGSVNVSVKSEGSRGNSDLIRFDITDTGIGISEGDRGTIFNEFTRISDRKKYEGAGLGLSIAHRIITLLKGEIAVESEPGKGSRFAIRLPLEPSFSSSTLEHNKDQEYTINRMKILAIDDDDVFLDLISEIIEKSGMQVHKCNSALQAIQVVDSFEPDLILTDLQMPTMNGMDMLAYIQRKTGKLIPVILITGQDSPDTGGIVFSDVLKKPFSPDELLNSINHVIRRKDIVIRERYSSSGKSAANNFYDYNLDQIRQFTLDDPDSMQRILTSFAESSYENLILFNKYIKDKDRKQLSELAHKMLAMFRQLEAKPIVDLLLKIERDYQKMNEEGWSQIGQETVNLIGQFINMFCEEQKISL